MPSTLVKVDVGDGVLMPLGAMSLPLVAHANAITTKDVLSQGDEFQVVGADTGRVYAEVVGNEVARDGADKRFVGPAMGKFGLVIGDSKNPIARSVAIGHPSPASICDTDLLPEPLGLGSFIAVTGEGSVALQPHVMGRAETPCMGSTSTTFNRTGFHADSIRERVS